MRSLLIAKFTFKEALRKKLVIGVILLSIVFVALYVWGFSSLKNNFDERIASGNPPPFSFEFFANALVLMGFYTVNFLCGVMAIFASVGSIASEIDNGTLHSIVPKPIRRWEIVLGKWLGYAFMLAIYVLLMCAAVVITGKLIGDYVPPRYIYGSLLVVLVGIVLLSITVLGSTLFSSLTNGIVVFMLYGVSLMGGIVKQVGEILDSSTLKNIGLATNLVIPSDTLWRLASYVIQPRFSLQMGPTLLSSDTPPSNMMVVYAFAYITLALLIANWIFARRDL
ncbi:hypothetical protein Tter_0462 [Thermobaculum terrenum ATCC BAA-798]|uniref:ABC-type transport system involved in multi-copper enzyme maturation permease component-like protein n=1 Tax=Thermobaculum terrenum (strain ATCC BAA-798 / CCMEE 7001 / YNP1) TaxID=525904 RepID=D1CEM7_THET1|nr:ABC transporter permease [Thermobaculum terrenum]ACZ41383.1 hypothetical protein Tter_0462 [Thermobaculum terrenum ATCC BAA-798]